MAEIQVEVRPGEFAPFEIKGEKPNYVEMKQIEKLTLISSTLKQVLKIQL